jgi:23S rRNA pseudouridine1911/1915/1917 synthase
MTQLEYTIFEAWAGQKISFILRRQLGVSAILLRLLRQTPASILLDGAPVSFYTCPTAGQRLTVRLPNDPPSDIVPTQGELDICYEDAHIYVINKPAGLCVHPGPDHHNDTLGNYLAWLERTRGEARTFRPVNRLDRGTSGLLCVAKHGYAAERLRQSMRENLWHKSYLAVCEGVPSTLSGTIDAPIGRLDGSVLMRQVQEDGKPARTRYQVLSGYQHHTLVQLWPETGRTHQIRVHMAHIGHPLVGDFLYGTEQPDLITHTALHAYELSFPHPITGKMCSFTTPMPQDMQALIYAEL